MVVHVRADHGPLELDPVGGNEPSPPLGEVRVLNGTLTVCPVGHAPGGVNQLRTLDPARAIKHGVTRQRGTLESVLDGDMDRGAVYVGLQALGERLSADEVVTDETGVGRISAVEYHRSNQNEQGRNLNIEM